MRRTGLVIAILAALLGAPSVVFATTNLLADADASPATGTTDTAFVLQVAYAGRFPALGVTAHVANRSIELELRRGTREAGTWSASTRLPAGAWPVVFVATPERGNAPSLAGLIITVTGPSSTPAATPLDTAEGSPPEGPGSPRQDTIDADGADGPTDPGNPRAPDGAAADPEPAEPDGEPAEPDGEPRDATAEADRGEGSVGGAPSPGARPASNPGTEAAGGDQAGGDADGAPTGVPDASPAPAGAVTPTVTPAAGTRSTPDAALAGDRAAPDETEVTSTGELTAAAWVVGVWLAAVLAGMGVLLFLARRRRRRATEGPSETSIDATDALLERRALRRGRVRFVEDPIVASVLGYRTDAAADDEDEDVRGPSARPRPSGRSRRR